MQIRNGYRLEGERFGERYADMVLMSVHNTYPPQGAEDHIVGVFLKLLQAARRKLDNQGVHQSYQDTWSSGAIEGFHRRLGELQGASHANASPSRPQ